jgi:hypothetical protein
MGLLGCEKGEEEESTAEAMKLDVKMPSPAAAGVTSCRRRVELRAWV